MNGLETRACGYFLAHNSEQMSEKHDFDNTVVAILDEKPVARDAVESLSAAGFDFEVLAGEEGRQHLDPDEGDGWAGKLRDLLTTFGDQKRIVKRLGEALEEGKLVVSVDIADQEPADAIGILKNHGGRYIWRLGEWTFTPIDT